MLDFHKPTLADKPLVDQYLFRWGEGSCQHSFVAMYCTEEKYGDRICEQDGYLFILRSRMCEENKRVYLFPMGDTENEMGIRHAIQAVLDDAHAHRCLVYFDTLTRQAKEICLRLFPGQFEALEKRDYAEYLYTREKLALLPGREMAAKRHDLSTLMRDYGDQLTVQKMLPAHIPQVMEFQKAWLESRGENDDSSVQLAFENTCIQRGLAHFEALGLSGIVVYYGERLCGYAYGAALTPAHYDVIIEKGDRSIPDIYRLLNRDLVRVCCNEYALINREEDLGVEGLRKAKLSYKPDQLLMKYLVKEVTPLE